MRTFSFFLFIAFLCFFGIGYWNGARQVHPGLDQHAMRRITPESQKDGTYVLVYRTTDGRLVAYSPGTEKLSSNFLPSDPRVPNVTKIDPVLLAAIAGTTATLNIDALTKNRSVVRLLNRATGRSKTQRILGTIVGAITGYSLGEYFGTQSTVDPNSDDIRKFLSEEKSWKAITANYCLYRLARTKLALEDLPEHIYEKFLPKIVAAETAVVALRSASKVDTFANELKIVTDIERELEPHFRFMQGMADASWQEFLDQLWLAGFFMLGSALLITGWLVYDHLPWKRDAAKKGKKT